MCCERHYSAAPIPYFQMGTHARMSLDSSPQCFVFQPHIASQCLMPSAMGFKGQRPSSVIHDPRGHHGPTPFNTRCNQCPNPPATSICKAQNEATDRKLQGKEQTPECTPAWRPANGTTLEEGTYQHGAHLLQSLPECGQNHSK